MIKRTYLRYTTVKLMSQLKWRLYDGWRWSHRVVRKLNRGSKIIFQALQQALLQQQVALGLKADNKNQSTSLQNQVISRKWNRKWTQSMTKTGNKLGTVPNLWRICGKIIKEWSKIQNENWDRIFKGSLSD